MIFTNRCRYCGRLLTFGESICNECRGNLPIIKGERCRFCGAAKERCSCKKHRMQYDGITSPFYYEGATAKAVLSLKYGEREWVANTLAEDMAECVLRDFGKISFDFICFVPFGKTQKIERAYNQSELLAEALSKKLKIPLMGVLVKVFETGAQHTLGGSRRAGNVAGAYEVKRNADIRGKTVLLVDDIKTTGATLNECAKILKIRRAERVFCVTAALAAKKSDENNSNNKLNGEIS